MEPGPVSSSMAQRPERPWSPPEELVPVWNTFAANWSDYLTTALTPDHCAASFVRAVMDPEPALRYMTHPPCEEMVRSKVVDLDGKSVADVALNLVTTKGLEEGSTELPVEAEHSDK